MPPDTLRLRPLSHDDIEIMAKWGTDAELCAAAEWSIGLPLETHRDHWQRVIDNPSSDLVRLAVTIEKDRIVGYADLFGSDPDQRELGFVIGDRSRWGQGLGYAAAAAMIDYGFVQVRLRSIIARAWDANVRSIRILRRLGMREIGRGEDGIYRGTHTFNRVFLLTAQDAAARSGTPPSI